MRKADEAGGWELWAGSFELGDGGRRPSRPAFMLPQWIGSENGNPKAMNPVNPAVFLCDEKHSVPAGDAACHFPEEYGSVRLNSQMERAQGTIESTAAGRLKVIS